MRNVWLWAEFMNNYDSFPLSYLPHPPSRPCPPLFFLSLPACPCASACLSACAAARACVRVPQAQGQAGEGGGSARRKPVALEDFEVLRVIGKGSFGKVFLVQRKASEDDTPYAMKVTPPLLSLPLLVPLSRTHTHTP